MFGSRIERKDSSREAFRDLFADQILLFFDSFSGM